MNNVVIAIDGPAGAGKSTVAKRLAHELGLTYLDTGAMYRCVALAAEKQGLSRTDAERAGALAERIDIEFKEGEPQRVLLDGEDVTDAIRTAEIGELASALSAFSPVRRALVKKQKQIVAKGDVVLEGRDAGTVIAPDATLKIFLTADLRTRAERRLKEFQVHNPTISVEQVEAQIAHRDERDSTREDSPLKKAEDAVELDTSGITIEEVLMEIRRLTGAPAIG